MRAIEMLKQDHKAVQGLFHQFGKAGDRALQQKQRIAEKTFEALEVHTTLEEEIFYPAVRVADQSGNDMVNEATEEHNVVKGLIGELKTTAPDAEEYDAKFKVLTENVRHHIEEEETEMFPHARAHLDNAKLNELRDHMVARKQQLTSAQRSLLSGTLDQAKKLVAKAFDALTSPTPEAQSGRGNASKSKRSPRRVARGRKAVQSTPRSPRAKKTAGKRTVQQAIAATRRVKGAARPASSRKTTGPATANKHVQRGSRS